MPFTVEELVMPATADAPDAADLIAVAEIRNIAEAYAYGHDENRLEPVELLPHWQDPKNPVRLFGVRVDGTLVGCAVVDWLLEDDESAWAYIHVLPSHREQGIGTALAERAEALVGASGRTKLVTYAPSKDAEGDRINAPTGFGSVPASNPEVRFLLGRGYRLEQVERGSRLALPAIEAVPTPAPGYRLHYWQDHTPAQWQEDMALLLTRMSTDAPSAGLEEPEDVYTVDRLLAYEEAQSQSPRAQLVVAVEHEPNGQLVGFSELRVPAQTARAVHQGDTLVLREHRGHRLGMLMKTANLERLQRERPGHPSVITYNAEENRPMLDVNEAVGFVPMGYEGAWRKDL